MRGTVQTIFRVMEEYWESILQRGIPAAKLRDQVPTAALPPTGNTGSGYSPADHDHTATADGGVLTNDAHDGYSVYTEIAAPSAPAANTTRLYSKDVAGLTEMFYKNSAGTERDLSATGGGGSLPPLVEGDLIIGDSIGDPVALPIGDPDYMLYSDGTTAFWDVKPPPSGVATGDLDGTYPAPLVDGFQGVAISNAAPNDGEAFVYSVADGFYTLQPVGTGGIDLMSLIYNAIANGTDDPIDVKITSGDYVVLIWFKGNNTSGWSSPTNALHTVTTGKRFIVVGSWGSSALLADTASRKARLRNTTDSTDAVTDIYFSTPYGQLNIPYVGDGATATTLNSAASTKAIELQLWNTDTTKRAMGAIVIGKEV